MNLQLRVELKQINAAGLNFVKHKPRNLELSFYHEKEQNKPTVTVREHEFPAITEAISTIDERVDMEYLTIAAEQEELEKLWE